MTWHMGPTDLTSVVHAAVAATRQLFRDKSVALSLTLEEGLGPVNGDADRLKQVVINLLSNAVKFAPAGTGRVRVTLGQEGGRQTVRVADNGPGIAREDRATIFEPFRQGGDGLTVTSEGTGLGLPICRPDRRPSWRRDRGGERTGARRHLHRGPPGGGRGRRYRSGEP